MSYIIYFPGYISGTRENRYLEHRVEYQYCKIEDSDGFELLLIGAEEFSEID